VAKAEGSYLRQIGCRDVGAQAVGVGSGLGKPVREVDAAGQSRQPGRGDVAVGAAVEGSEEEEEE